MHRFEWNDDLSMGDENLDGQHRDLIAEVNRLLDACKRGEGQCRFDEVLAGIERYATEHFRDEEEYQERIGYPGIEEHKVEHRRFLAEFGALKDRFGEAGPSLALAINTSSFVTNWLKNHLAGKDRDLARFVALRM